MSEEFDEDHAMSLVLNNIFIDEDSKVPAVPQRDIQQPDAQLPGQGGEPHHE